MNLVNLNLLFGAKSYALTFSHRIRAYRMPILIKTTWGKIWTHYEYFWQIFVKKLRCFWINISHERPLGVAWKFWILIERSAFYTRGNGTYLQPIVQIVLVSYWYDDKLLWNKNLHAHTNSVTRGHICIVSLESNITYVLN